MEARIKPLRPRLRIEGAYGATLILTDQSGWRAASATSAVGAKVVPVTNTFERNDLAQQNGRQVSAAPDFSSWQAHKFSASTNKRLESIGTSGYLLQHITQFHGRRSDVRSVVSPGGRTGSLCLVKQEVRSSWSEACRGW